HQKLVQADNSANGIVLFRGTIRRSADCSFHHLFYPLSLGLHILEQRAESVLSANRQSIRGHYFYQNKALNESNLWTHQHPQLKLLLVLKQTQVQLFKKSVSNSATQDSIMSAHNKTQFTYARINCVLKDSSCDTPLQKILMLAIPATCASSSSTKSI
ncbi:hypothetical protein H5410_041213, partial [Solanum commersonii]